MATAASSIAPLAEADRLWREIAVQLREACILRREGRHQAAAAILEHDLPALVRDWSAKADLPPAEAKARLNQLFNEEQARVESHWIMARFLAQEQAAATARNLSAFPSVVAAAPADAAAVLTPMIPRGTMLFPAIAPRRIPISDVVDMIDAARDLERTVAHRPSLS